MLDVKDWETKFDNLVALVRSSWRLFGYVAMGAALPLLIGFAKVDWEAIGLPQHVPLLDKWWLWLTVVLIGLMFSSWAHGGQVAAILADERKAMEEQRDAVKAEYMEKRDAARRDADMWQKTNERTMADSDRNAKRAEELAAELQKCREGKQ